MQLLHTSPRLFISTVTDESSQLATLWCRKGRTSSRLCTTPGKTPINNEWLRPACEIWRRESPPQCPAIGGPTLAGRNGTNLASGQTKALRNQLKRCPLHRRAGVDGECRQPVHVIRATNIVVKAKYLWFRPLLDTIGIRSNNLEIRSTPERKEGIVSAKLWMGTAICRFHPQQLMDMGNALVQITTRIDQMINVAGTSPSNHPCLAAAREQYCLSLIGPQVAVG
eukprot:CAMPEP_0178645342 /NCGR_PEP_ID=MMETSP0698-20121128/18772_1 /TAXON_ID=265572 /ORGANISM="Extubocellulus spinifer, Strain CCMP396" /LENGTH=224 /DNA_ID=CAMNT_0020286389 /DNA_START=638 /DNA_END=1312 /DNA_ORIENTATION=-